MRGRPPYPKYTMQKQVVRWQLEWRPTPLAAHRARLPSGVATIACLRMHEVRLLQVCDPCSAHLTGLGMPGFEGTCSLQIVRHKNDTQRKGHWPAPGRSRNWNVDISAARFQGARQCSGLSRARWRRELSHAWR